MRDELRMLKRSSYLVVPFYLAAALVLTWPLAILFGSHLPAVFTFYDALLQVFLLGWGWHGLTSNPLEVFNAPIFYPEVRTLTYMDHMLGEAVLAGPVAAVFGLGAAYNSLVILSFVASAYFVYRLARLYGISRSGSCVAGFLFAFCPYRFGHLGALNQLQTQFIPLALFFGVRFLRTERLRYGIGAALTFVVQSYFGWYSTFHLLTALAVLLGWEALRSPQGWRRLPWRRIALLGVVSAALMLPSALPYVVQRLAMPEFERPIAETIRLSADPLHYLRVSPENVLARLVPGLGDLFGFFPGLVAMVLAVVAVVAMCRAPVAPIPPATSHTEPRQLQPQSRRRPLLERIRALCGQRESGFFPLLGLSGLVLSLGPILHVAGHRLWIPLPYALCYYVIPGFASMRTPARFAILVALAAAVLAGVGYDTLRRRYSRFGSVFLVVTLAVAGVLAWSPGLPFVRYPDRASMPSVYAWLASQPDTRPVLELPVPAGRHTESATDLSRQMYVLHHGKPRLDGASGFTSDRYAAFRREMRAFPGQQSIRSAYEMGARRLIVHYGDYAPALREGIRRRVDDAMELREVATFGQDAVYEIEDPGTQ
jgi:hypothetical protein